MSPFQEIEKAALDLPDKDRLILAERILGSLPPSTISAEPSDILTEAIQRDAELERGTVKPLSEEEFWNGARRTRG